MYTITNEEIIVRERIIFPRENQRLLTIKQSYLFGLYKSEFKILSNPDERYTYSNNDLWLYFPSMKAVSYTSSLLERIKEYDRKKSFNNATKKTTN